MFSKTYELDIDGEVNGPINYNIVDAGNIIGTVFLGLIAILLLIALLRERRRGRFHRPHRSFMHPQHKYNPIRID